MQSASAGSARTSASDRAANASSSRPTATRSRWTYSSMSTARTAGMGGRRMEEITPVAVGSSSVRGVPQKRHKSNPRGRLESRQRRIAPRESETGTYPPSAILPALLRRDGLVQEPRGAHIAGGDTRASLRERRHRWMDSVSSRRTGRTAAAGVRAPASGAQGE
jgi:hypothetical protein